MLRQMLGRKAQLSLQPLLAEFLACTDLRLKLPTGNLHLDRQVAQLLVTRGRLAKLQLQIQHYLMKEMPPQTRQQLHTLLHGTRDLLQLADSLIFLAEEYLLDPEGSIACLRQINKRKLNLLAQIQRSLAVTTDVGAIGQQL